ncbi:MAG: rRNA maturation RNase YbeY [Saprospiraceae bacterium]
MRTDITFHVLDDAKHPFPDTEEIYRTWIYDISIAEQRSISSINYIFCSDEYLLEINNKYLGHDYYTDIITFPYKELDDIESDMYISIDRITENAVDYGVTFTDELRRVMAHGLLHLMGYGDKLPEQIDAMRAKEDHYIALFPK